MFLNILISYFTGLGIGYFLEFIYRSTANKKLIKPLLINAQMYALTAVGLYLLHLIKISLIFKIIFIVILTTGIEFILGFCYLKYKNIRLWDYSSNALNYKGIICLKFSFYWFLLAGSYFYLLSKII